MKKYILCLVALLMSVAGVMAQTKNGGISEDICFAYSWFVYSTYG